MNSFFWMVVFFFKTLSLFPKNIERTRGKPIKLISACNVEWRNSNSVNSTLIIDFFWRISSSNKLNWHCWYVLKDFRDLVATRKFKTLKQQNYCYNWLNWLSQFELSTISSQVFVIFWASWLCSVHIFSWKPVPQIWNVQNVIRLLFYVPSLFLGNNDKVLKQKSTIQ